jgi:hypothetical protein
VKFPTAMSVTLSVTGIPSVFMYVMNIQIDVIGLVLRENCISKQVTDFIAWAVVKFPTAMSVTLSVTKDLLL